MEICHCLSALVVSHGTCVSCLMNCAIRLKSEIVSRLEGRSTHSRTEPSGLQMAMMAFGIVFGVAFSPKSISSNGYRPLFPTQTPLRTTLGHGKQTRRLAAPKSKRAPRKNLCRWRCCWRNLCTFAKKKCRKSALFWTRFLNSERGTISKG